MQSDTDPIHHLTDADRDSETRFGTRRVPEGHKTAAPYPHRPMRSTRIPPSDEGPYADQRRREPSLAATLFMLGGAGVMAVAATSAAVLAARKLADALGGDDRDGAMSGGGKARRSGLAPRFAEMDEDEQEAIRRRARARARRDQARAAELRAAAARERAAPRRNVAREMTETATGLSRSLNGAVASVAGAVTGMRQVAAQAGGLMREFSAAAETVQSFLDRSDTKPAPRDEEARPAPDSRSERDQRLHRL